MIRSFRDSDTKSVFNRDRVSKFSMELQRRAQSKLDVLHSAANLYDLQVPPGNRPR